MSERPLYFHRPEQNRNLPNFHDWFDTLVREKNSASAAGRLVQVFFKIERETQKNGHFKRGMFTWNKERIGITDDRPSLWNLRKEFGDAVNHSDHASNFYFHTERELHDFLDYLGFTNGGNSSKDDIQLHIYRNSLGNNKYAKKFMFTTAKSKIEAYKKQHNIV